MKFLYMEGAQMQMTANLCESKRRPMPYESSCSSFTLALADAAAWVARDFEADQPAEKTKKGKITVRLPVKNEKTTFKC
jgi:hypothetical protein